MPIFFLPRPFSKSFRFVAIDPKMKNYFLHKLQPAPCPSEPSRNWFYPYPHCQEFLGIEWLPVQARLNVEQQGIQLKFYRNQLFPEVDLIGSYGFNGSGSEYRDSFNQMGDASRPYYSYGGQLTVPLSNVGPRNQLKAGKATEKQLLLQLKQLEQNVMVQIDNAVKAAESAWESADATRQQRIYAEAALKAEQGKYAVGKSTTFIVLQLQTALTTARSQEIRALANYNQALASLAAAEGSSLQRDNLAIEAK